ncbi:hypothetical protein C7B80_26165 [Cyanosarcina cf. burmensis CCALA 770]|nr:hypothetical protein C7B80_26165 [Cyanosarcina cf. burmensis CCALA 770]
MIATECSTEQSFNDFSDVLDRLDEYGLTPNQFRIYCHLFKNAVDGVVSESSESIAKTCKLTRVTVLRVVSQLAQMNLIQCEVTPGKKSVFHLMPFSDWQQPVSEQKQSIAKVQSKVVPLRVSEGRQAFRQGHRNQSNSDTCKADTQVNQINTQEQGRQDNPIGLSCLPPAEKPVNEIDLSTADTGSLDGKLAAARARGWQDSGTWWMTSGQQVVTVNRFVVSVGEFMGRSLDSFDVGRQICEEGLAMCRKQIEKIKQRKSQQLCDRAMAIASS